MEATVTTLGCHQLLCGQIIHKLSMSEMLRYLRKYWQERDWTIVAWILEIT